MEGLNFLGAETIAKRISWSRGVLTIAAGAIAAALTPKHPVLAAIGVGALVNNAHAVATGDRTVHQAGRRMGRHVVATAGSLALPKYPGFGWLAGAIAGELLFDGEGGGIVEDWGVVKEPATAKQENIVDAEFTEKSDSKALVKK